MSQERKEMNERLRERREWRGATQSEVAKCAGISLKSYQRIEHGTQEPTVRTAIRIARALGTSAEALFGETKTGSDVL